MHEDFGFKMNISKCGAYGTEPEIYAGSRGTAVS